MKISIKPSFYLDCLPPHFRSAIHDDHWETMIPPEDATFVDPHTPLHPAGASWTTQRNVDPRFPESGPLPELIDADFPIHRTDSVYEAGLEALELASIQLVSWGVPGLAVKCCLSAEEVVLREVRLTFRMQARGEHLRWEVTQLSDIEGKSTHDEAAWIIYANASLEQDQWHRTASDVGPRASISDVVTIDARLSKGYLESYGLDELVNWEEIDLPALCGTLFDVFVLGIPFVPYE